MTLEQLRIFVAIAERQHVTATARALNLTQSAVSNALAALEERHAVQLFDRVGRGIVLNQNGRMFLDEARAVIARATLAEAVLADLSGLRRGRLGVFASQTIAGYWLPARLVRFHGRHPGIELDVRVGNTHEVAEAVLDGRCELGLVEGEVGHALLDRLDVGTDRLLVLTHPSHPWTRQRSPHGRDLNSHDLGQAPWIMREPGSGTRSSLEAALVAAGCHLPALTVRMTLPSNEAVLSAVQAGDGVAVLSEHVARGPRGRSRRRDPVRPAGAAVPPAAPPRPLPHPGRRRLPGLPGRKRPSPASCRGRGRRAFRPGSSCSCREAGGLIWFIPALSLIRPAW